MAKTTIERLAQFGQSVWLDSISRSMIESGYLKKMIQSGLRGMTSNPTIFEQAISKSSDYDERIERLHRQGRSTFEIYDDLTIRDIQDAADMFLPVYERTKGLDGYVSLEINPQLAHEMEATIAEGKRLNEKVNRPNVMFKVPSTDEGFGAIKALLASGINVNVTLIFSLKQYVRTAEAFLKGMAALAERQPDLSRMASVASVFVSRIDTAADKRLDDESAKASGEGKKKGLQALKGKAAVANAHLIYSKYMEIVSGPAFRALQEKGARAQRVLWGSTGTKNPAYSDIKYVTELIGKDTVNTLPEKTIAAFLDHGKVEEALTASAQESQLIIERLRGFGLDVDAICGELLTAGVKSFTDSFESLLATLEEKGRAVAA